MLLEVESFAGWLRRVRPFTSTALHYASDVTKFLRWVSKPAREVLPSDVDGFIVHCQERLRHQPATINRRIAALRTFYNYLSWLEPQPTWANPVIPKRHFIREGERLPRDARDEDIVTLFSVIDHPRDRAMFLLMLRCGLRVSEVRGLNLHDVDLHPAPGLPRRVTVLGKGRKQRTAYLSSEAYLALGSWLAERGKLGAEPRETAVFLNYQGQRLSVTGIQKTLMHYCERAGVWITCHQFRHTFGRHLAEQGVPATTIQKLLGHAWLRTSERYIHLSDPITHHAYELAMHEIERDYPASTGGVA